MTGGVRRVAWCLVLLTGVGTAAIGQDGPDPIVVGGKWTGRVTQKGKIGGTEFPLELDATLTVTRRDGGRFEAELAEKGPAGSGIEVTYVVAGEVTRGKGGKEYAVQFKSNDVKEAKAQTFLNIPYSGTVTGKMLRGTWKHPKNDAGTTIEGEFSFEMRESGG